MRSNLGLSALSLVIVCSSLVSSLVLGVFSAEPAQAGPPEYSSRRPLPLPQEKMKYLYSKDAFIVFDWDDNIFKLPSWNALFVRGEEGDILQRRVFLISAGELSMFRDEIGKPGGPLERFELIGDDVDPMNGSYRFSRPGRDGTNHMLNDMARSIAPDGYFLDRVPDRYKAPFYELFMARESKPETRQANRILTGRGQTQAEFHDALHLLAQVPEVAQMGFRATEESRLTLVGGKGFAHELKAVDLVNRMHEAAEKGYKLFVFPDDDPMNIRRAAEVFAAIERPIPVWLIWTRENGRSGLVDMTRLGTATKPGITIQELLKEALDPATHSDPKTLGTKPVLDPHHEKAKAALFCRALFF